MKNFMVAVGRGSSTEKLLEALQRGQTASAFFRFGRDDDTRARDHRYR